MDSFLAIFSIIWIIGIIVWGWTIIDIIKSTFKDQATKIIWLLLVVFIPLFGLIIYAFVGRSTKLKEVSVEE